MRKNLDLASYLVTTEQMRYLEQATVEAGASWASLMEQAGWGVAQEAFHELGEVCGKRVVVLVGPGNNGGDGLVAARHLHDADAQVLLYIWHRKGPERDANWQQCRQRGMVEVVADTDDNQQRLNNLLHETDLVIDALLGMGTSRPVAGTLAAIVERVNHWRKTSRLRNHREAGQLPLPAVLAIDMPTGIHSDSGQVLGVALAADRTIATGLIKRGLMAYPGHRYAGTIQVADIGIPSEKLEAIMSETMNAKKARSLLPERPADGHKGTFGKVLVVAGSLHYPGASILATAGAGRVGAGLVTLATARSIVGASGRGPEVTLLPLPEADIGTLGRQAATELMKHVGNYQALLIGPGLGHEEATVQFLKRVLNLEAPQEQSPVGFRVGEAEHGREPEGWAAQAKKGKEREKDRVGFRTGTPETTSEKAETEPSEASPPYERPPLVLDADGLNILATIENWYEQFPREECILTPHPGEMKRLLNVDELEPDHVQVATDAAARWGQVVVLKGATTVIAAPDGRSVVHTAGNPALATAGTGDVLAGILAGLLAQGMTLFDAAVLGVYLHAQAGDMVRETLGDTGALASDLLPNLPKVIKQIRGK